MRIFQAAVGIDPSGGRLALSARGGPAGREGVHAVVPFRETRPDAQFEEAEKALSEFVALHGLSGCPARLCVPAERTYLARIRLPRLKERDMRAALSLEVDRLFPFPSSRLLFAWRWIGPRQAGKESPLRIAAAPADYVDRWKDVAARAGLSLESAFPAAWGAAASCREAGGLSGAARTAVVRQDGPRVEVTLLAGSEPFFASARIAPPGASGAGVAVELAGFGLAGEEGAEGEPVRLLAPPGLSERIVPVGKGAGIEFAPREGFGAPAVPEGEGTPPGQPPLFWATLSSSGAAADGRALDLLRTGEGKGPRTAVTVAAALGAACLLLGLAWPLAVSARAKSELASLDARIAELRPAVADVEQSLAELAQLEERASILREAAKGRGESILVLRELTDRLPAGTWLTGFRYERRKVEIDGISPSANELFPILARDGRFHGVEFASPITRQPDNLERFQIRAEYVPPGDGGEGGGR